MKESQWPASDLKAAAVMLDRALSNIPVRHVVTSVAQHRHIGEQAGYHVHPALVDKNAAIQGNDAVASELGLPPNQHGLHVGAAAQGAKTKVVGSRPANIKLCGKLGVIDGRQKMGCEH